MTCAPKRVVGDVIQIHFTLQMYHPLPKFILQCYNYCTVLYVVQNMKKYTVKYGAKCKIFSMTLNCDDSIATDALTIQ